MTDSAFLEGTLIASPSGSELVGTLRVRPTTPPWPFIGMGVLVLVFVQVQHGTTWPAIVAMSLFTALVVGVQRLLSDFGYPEHFGFLEAWVTSRLGAQDAPPSPPGLPVADSA